MSMSCRSLEQLHRDCIVRLAEALGKLRMLAIGAPFADELVELAEDDVKAALHAVRAAEALRTEIRRMVGGFPISIEGEQ
jgi:hypothetical protein